MLSAERGPERTGYVVKVYPRFSETFIVRELLAREAQGEDLVVAALRPTTDPRFHDMISKVQAPVSWIPHELRSSRRLWEAVNQAQHLPGLTATLPELLAEDFDVAGQAVLLARWAAQRRVTHLHAHFASLPGRTTRLAARLAGIPYSVTAHAKDLFHADVDRRRLHAVLVDAQHVVTVSDHNVAWIGREHPAALERVRRVYNGLDLGDLQYRDPTDRPPVVSAVGRPCVSTPVTGIPEVVRDGETGLLVPERDPFALADALQRLLQDPPLRHRLSAGGRALVEAEFDVLAFWASPLGAF